MIGSPAKIELLPIESAKCVKYIFCNLVGFANIVNILLGSSFSDVLSISSIIASAIKVLESLRSRNSSSIFSPEIFRCSSFITATPSIVSKAPGIISALASTNTSPHLLSSSATTCAAYSPKPPINGWIAIVSVAAAAPNIPVFANLLYCFAPSVPALSACSPILIDLLTAENNLPARPKDTASANPIGAPRLRAKSVNSSICFSLLKISITALLSVMSVPLFSLRNLSID